MSKIKDPILLGIVSGLSGIFFKSMGNLIFRKTGLNKTSYPQLAAGIFLKKKKTNTPEGKLVGLLADAALGAGLGVGYAYVLKFTGKDHAVLKGIGYGHGAWTLLLGGANKMGVSGIFPLAPSTILSSYAEHALYGLGAALAATTFGDKDFFKKEDIDALQGSTGPQPDDNGNGHFSSLTSLR